MAETEIRDDLRYSKEDEWVRQDGEQLVIGITDYAQQQLGDIVFVELPEVGTEVKTGQPFGVIESVKAVSDLFAPVSGQVVAINEELNDQPELVNNSCYGEGWIIAIAGGDSGELMDAAAYAKHVADRSD